MFIRFCLFEEKYKLIVADICKQKSLDADSRAIQQIIFPGKIDVEAANTRVTIYYFLKKSKETILQFSIGIIKFLYLV